jgi:hypothetical protein
MSRPFVGDRTPKDAVVGIASNRADPKIESGENLPCLFQMESPSSVNMLIDSKDRTNGNDARFQVDLKYRLPRPRYVTLKKVIIPKIPNVTSLNNGIRINHEKGLTDTFYIPPGIYNTTDLANTLTAVINAAFAAVGILDTVTTTYSVITRSFSIQSVSPFYFFIIDTSTFILRGEFLVPFASQPITDVPSSSVVYSGIAGMLYTRYLTISSDSLTQNSFSSSILSRVGQPNNIIGLVDIADIYTADDFDVSKPFTSLYRTLDVDGPKLSVMTGARTLNSNIDITITDGYGYCLEEALNLGPPFPENKLGLVLMFIIDF